MLFEQLNKFRTVESKTGEKEPIKTLNFTYLGLYFTADWCKACRHGSKKLQESVEAIEKAYPSCFKLITIRMDDTISNFGYHFWKIPTLKYSDSQELYRVFKVVALPTILIFNENGRLISKDGYEEITKMQGKAFQKWSQLDF